MKTFYLEMTSPAALRAKAFTDPHLRVLETAVAQPSFNKYLYRLVGRQWQWVDRLRWSDEEWEQYVCHGRVRTWVAYHHGTPAGYFELQKQDQDDVEIVYFGLAPSFIGQGLGGPLLSEAVRQAWAWQARRVWLHTCTWDHEHALANYQARGFVLYRVDES